MPKKTESPDQNSSNLKRLKKIEGQIRGVIGMVEDDRYCIDILKVSSRSTRATSVFITIQRISMLYILLAVFP